MNTRTSALDALIFGVDVQSGDVRGDAPSYAVVAFDGEHLDRDVVSRRKLLRLIEREEPALVATDNMYELAEDKDALVGLLRSLPDGTRLVQVTGDERPEPLSRVASRHGVPYGKDPMQEAEAAARLAARNVGYEVSAFADTTEVKVSRGRSTGKGGWSEDRYTRKIHGAVRKRAREVERELDDAGLDYEREVTEKYGGFANATFLVEAPQKDIPVSAVRSGDVRVEVEPVRRDGIEFQPLAKRRDHVVVGVDPGTTTAVALVGLDGGVLDVMSTRTADNAAVIEWIIERGRPIVVAADVTPMPGTVDKIRRSFDAGGWEPDADLPVDEKQHRTREHDYDDDHQRDAMAAALFAHDAHADQFDRIARKLPPGLDVGEVTARVVAGEESVEAVVADLTDEEPDEPEESAHAPRELTAEEKRIKRLESRVDRLTDHVDDLETTVEVKDDRIAALESELSTARSEERKQVRKRREVTRLERENDRLERELAEQEAETERLAEKLDRLKELWKLDHSNFADVAELSSAAGQTVSDDIAEGRDLVAVKPVAKFTTGDIEATEREYGIAAGDVVLLRDASGAGRSTAERLAELEPRVVLKQGGLSEVAADVLFEHEIPVGPADEVSVEEIDDLAVARESDVEAVVEDWRDRAAARERAETEEAIDRLISEHRAERTGESD